MTKGRKIKKPEKLNLVPILDSVFIFIFFLLMSAQFVDVYEIGSTVPMTKELPDQTQKDPLNLTLEITKEEITVKAGTRTPLTRKFLASQKVELLQFITELKKKHPQENTMIIKSAPRVPFQNIVSVIDNTRAPAGSNEKLFEQIVFDNNRADL